VINDNQSALDYAGVMIAKLTESEIRTPESYSVTLVYCEVDCKDYQPMESRPARTAVQRKQGRRHDIKLISRLI